MPSHTRTAVLPLPWALAAKLSTLLLAGALMFGVACGSDSGSSAATLESPDQTGTELANKYIELLQDKDVEGLSAFLSNAFIIQRADGSHSEKADYLQNIPDIGSFTITDVTALQANDALIVRWFLTVNEVVDGKPYSAEPAPRLSTFVYDEGDWRLSSHANFNAPDTGDATPPASPTTSN